MITLYDFETNLPGKGLSLFVWRVRFALNIKGIQYETKWLSYAEVPKLADLGFKPTAVRADGSPRYTVPSIYDSTTGQRLSDSHAILKYLDEAYPDTPQLCTPPPGENRDFVLDAFKAGWDLAEETVDPMWCFMAPTIITKGLGGESAARYKRNFEGYVGTPLEVYLRDKARREEHRLVVERAYAAVDEWMKKARENHEGPWLLGKEPTLPDVVLASCVAWVWSTVGEDGEEWKWITEEWDDGGRWKAVWKQIQPYKGL